jgi:hypothetical protein
MAGNKDVAEVGMDPLDIVEEEGGGAAAEKGRRARQQGSWIVFWRGGKILSHRAVKVVVKGMEGFNNVEDAAGTGAELSIGRGDDGGEPA